MVQVTDEAFVLSVKQHAEKLAIVKCLTRNNGIFSGSVRNILTKGAKGVYLPANLIKFSWSARLEEHLGILSGDLVRSYSANFFYDRNKAYAVSSLLELIEFTFHERDHIPALFELLLGYLESLQDKDFSVRQYVIAEIKLLEMAGYILQLERCGVTGVRENLAYVSPRSGRAISWEVGRAYHDQLLLLPSFLIDDRVTANSHDIENAFRLSEYFLQRYVYKDSYRKLPKVRKSLVEGFFYAS